MALHLFHLPSSRPPDPDSSATLSTAPEPSTSAHVSSPSSATSETPPPAPQLHLLIGYESGHLALFRFSPTASFEQLDGDSERVQGVWAPKEGKMVEENEGWELVWSEKGHRDAGASASFAVRRCSSVI